MSRILRHKKHSNLIRLRPSGVTRYLAVSTPGEEALDTRDIPSYSRDAYGQGGHREVVKSRHSMECQVACVAFGGAGHFRRCTLGMAASLVTVLRTIEGGAP